MTWNEFVAIRDATIRFDSNINKRKVRRQMLMWLNEQYDAYLDDGNSMFTGLPVTIDDLASACDVVKEITGYDVKIEYVDQGKYGIFPSFVYVPKHQKDVML